VREERGRKKDNVREERGRKKDNVREFNEGGRRIM
jgi:hypothetical protein